MKPVYLHHLIAGDEDALASLEFAKEHMFTRDFDVFTRDFDGNTCIEIRITPMNEKEPDESGSFVCRQILPNGMESSTIRGFVEWMVKVLLEQVTTGSEVARLRASLALANAHIAELGGDDGHE